MNYYHDLYDEVAHHLINLGKKGANADINHPDRVDWERMRLLLEKINDLKKQDPVFRAFFEKKR